jgi:hypothetical protein
MRLLISWQKGAHCTHLQDLNLPVVSLIELQGGWSRTGRAESTKNTGSLFLDKDMQRVLFLISTKRTVESLKLKTDLKQDK